MFFILSSKKKKDKYRLVRKKKKKTRSYTPFIQKTGILYKKKVFWRLLPFWILSHLLNIFHGLLYDQYYYDNFFHVNCYELFLYPFFYLWLNRIYVSTANSVDNLFFNEKKLSMLFKTKESFKNFRTSFHNRRYSKKEWILLLSLGIIAFPLFSIYNFFECYSTITPLYILGSIIGTIILGLVILSLLSMCYFLLAVFYTFFKFVDIKELSISSYLIWFKKLIDSQNEEPAIEDEEDTTILKTTLYTFQYNTRVIYDFLFKFFFKFIIVLLIIDLIFYIPPIFIKQLETEWIGIGFIWISLTLLPVLFFILTQIKVHILLKYATNEVIDGIKIMYNNLKIDLYRIFHTNDWEAQQVIMTKLSFFKEELGEVSKIGTGNYDFPAVLKLLVTGALSIIPTIIKVLGIG